MRQAPQRQFHTQELFRTARDLWPFWGLSLATSIGAFYAAWKLLDEQQRGAAIFAGCIFVILFIFILYENLRLAGDEVHALASGVQACRIHAGPRHAVLRARVGTWDCEGVVWLGVTSEPNSDITVTMTVPTGVEIDLRSQSEVPYVWKSLGSNPQGEKSYSVRISRSEAVTPLGQIAIRANNDQQGRDITLEAVGSDPQGNVVRDHLSVALLVDVPMKPV